MDPLQNTFICYKKTPCWKVNNAMGPWNERILAFWTLSLCFSYPNVLYMTSSKVFLYHVTIFSKGPITDTMGTLIRQLLWIGILKKHVLEIYHYSLKGQVFVKCKSNYGRLSRQLNQVPFLDIHIGIIFYRPEHIVFLKGCL